jgi:hemolysin activation/secretion protein
MGLVVFQMFAECHPGNYGGAVSRAEAGPHRGTAKFAAAGLVLMLSAVVSVPVRAQQPGFDPRQTEKRFDELQSGQTPADRSALRMPRLSRPKVAAESKPLFQLRGVSLTGAQAIPRDQMLRTYQPYLGKQVSQADLAAIAGSISDLYRAAGFHLSRAIVPDIRDGRVHLQVIEGSITEVALKGDGAEQFGVRPLLDPVLAEHPSRLTTLERQLLLINARPGVRIADTALEEIGVATGRFRLVVYLKTWHIYTSFGVDNLGSSAVGP